MRAVVGYEQHRVQVSIGFAENHALSKLRSCQAFSDRSYH